MTAPFHYVVRANIIRLNDNKEIEFQKFEDKFEREEPILAREEAFNRYQNIIDVLLESKNKIYINDRETREELKSFYDLPPKMYKLNTHSQIEIGGQEIDFYKSFGFGIGIFMIIDRPMPDWDMYVERPFIHGIGSDDVDPESLIYMLGNEYDYYKHFNFKTNNKEKEIPFISESSWDSEEDGAKDVIYINILETPFDWGGYDEPYWWDPESPLDKITPEILEIIRGGETSQVVFMPSLFFNPATRSVTFELKENIAQTICSLLNSRGGILLFGVEKDGKLQGLDEDFSLAGSENEYLFFHEEFDKIVKHYLPSSVWSNIEGKFYISEEIQIFLVFVTPYKKRTTSLKCKNS